MELRRRSRPCAGGLGWSTGAGPHLTFGGPCTRTDMVWARRAHLPAVFLTPDPVARTAGEAVVVGSCWCGLCRRWQREGGDDMAQPPSMPSLEHGSRRLGSNGDSPAHPSSPRRSIMSKHMNNYKQKPFGITLSLSTRRLAADLYCGTGSRANNGKEDGNGNKWLPGCSRTWAMLVRGGGGGYTSWPTVLGTREHREQFRQWKGAV